MEEMIIKDNEEYSKNEYKYRLLFEFRDTIEKRIKLGKYLSETSNKVMNDKTMNDKEKENRELLNKQFQILNDYEEILFNRLRLELTTN